MDEFEALVAERVRRLEGHGAQFEGMLERMQTPAAKMGAVAAFNASPQALGRAAAKAARK